MSSDTQAVFVAPGYLLFGRDTQLFRQAVRSWDPAVVRGRVPVVDRLRVFTQISSGEFSASNTGLLAYRSGLDASNQFTWLDRKGEPRGTVGPAGRYRTSALSPDGKRLVYTDIVDSNLKILDLQSQTTTVLTSDPGTETAPVWSTDGKRIYYRSDSGGVFYKEADGTSPPVKISDDLINGPTQYLERSEARSSAAVFRVSSQAAVNGYPHPSTHGAGIAAGDSVYRNRRCRAAGVARRQVARVCLEPNRQYELYVEPFLADGKPQAFRMSRSGGRQAMWRADSRELYFVGDDRRFYAVRIPESGPSQSIEPEFLFNLHANVANTRNSYVPSADGQRFLVNMVLDTEDAPINVISNWTGLMK